MTSRIIFAVFLLCPLTSGCGLFDIGAHNLINEAKLIHDSRLEKIRYAHLAHEAWEEVKASCPSPDYSVDYAKGFQAGFVDYLYAGGCGEPPSPPPKHYRHFLAESPRGAQALQDWYRGFRHGAAVAKNSGLRQYVIVSLPPPAVPQPPLPPAPPIAPSLPPPTAPIIAPLPPQPPTPTIVPQLPAPAAPIIAPLPAPSPPLHMPRPSTNETKGTAIEGELPPPASEVSEPLRGGAGSPKEKTHEGPRLDDLSAVGSTPEDPS